MHFLVHSYRHPPSHEDWGVNCLHFCDDLDFSFLFYVISWRQKRN